MTAAEPSINLSNAKIYQIDKFSHDRKRPLKIALLGYRSHPHVGGQGIYLKYLSRALKNLGHHVDVVSGPPYPEVDSDINLIRVPSLDLFAQTDHVKAIRFKHLKSYTDTFEWWSMLTGGFAEPYTFGRRVKKILANADYDIIHDNQSLCYALLDLQDKGTTVVSTIHHPIHMDRKLALGAAEKWGDRLLIKRWYSFLKMQEKVVKKLRNVITVSQTSQQDIEHYFSRCTSKTPVISNGIDTTTFCPLRDIPREAFRIITTTSSDQPLKGLSYLLEAVAKIKGTYPDVHLRVIGKLKPGGVTETQLKRLGLINQVSFISGISTTELVKEYARASVVVCPSLYEGFGLPAGEAMACELPIIATNGGALPEVVSDAGLIVDAGDSQAIAEKLSLLFKDKILAETNGKRARKHIKENFSWEKVAYELTLYYQDIISCAHD